MKKLMKKKVSLLGKEFSVLALVAVMMIGLVSAALVPYLSNIINGTVDVDSPITIEVTANSAGAHTADTYTASIYGGESFTINTTTTIHVDGLTGHIAENKIIDFDGVGITVMYRDANWPGYFILDVCTEGSDAYFYIGDPDEVLNASSLDSTTTFAAALNLDPNDSLDVESKVILEASAACTYADPVFVAD
jgi:hypothetical protein